MSTGVDCLDHLGIAQFEVEDREIGGEMVGIGGARDRDDALLRQIAQRHAVQERGLGAHAESGARVFFDRQQSSKRRFFKMLDEIGNGGIELTGVKKLNFVVLPNGDLLVLERNRLIRFHRLGEPVSREPSEAWTTTS